MYDRMETKVVPVSYKDVLDSLAKIFGRVPLFTELEEPIRRKVT